MFVRSVYNPNGHLNRKSGDKPLDLRIPHFQTNPIIEPKDVEQTIENQAIFYRPIDME